MNSLDSKVVPGRLPEIGQLTIHGSLVCLPKAVVAQSKALQERPGRWSNRIPGSKHSEYQQFPRRGYADESQMCCNICGESSQQGVKPVAVYQKGNSGRYPVTCLLNLVFPQQGSNEPSRSFSSIVINVS